MRRLATLILAGGQAKRFPGKLSVRLDGIPLLLRVIRNTQDFAPISIAGHPELSVTLDAALECRVLIDEHPGSGPLGAILSAFRQIEATHIAVVAGDMPFVTATILHTLATALDGEDEASVATHDHTREPLLAIYDRQATLHAGEPLFATGERSVGALLDTLRVREVDISSENLANINRREDALLHFTAIEGPS